MKIFIFFFSLCCLTTIVVGAPSCNTHSDCPNRLPKCHSGTNTCVACLRNTHCNDNDPCTIDICRKDLTCAHRAKCANNEMCLGNTGDCRSNLITKNATPGFSLDLFDLGKAVTKWLPNRTANLRVLLKAGVYDRLAIQFPSKVRLHRNSGFVDTHAIKEGFARVKLGFDASMRVFFDFPNPLYPALGKKTYGVDITVKEYDYVVSAKETFQSLLLDGDRTKVSLKLGSVTLFKKSLIPTGDDANFLLDTLNFNGVATLKLVNVGVDTLLSCQKYQVKHLKSGKSVTLRAERDSKIFDKIGRCRSTLYCQVKGKPATATLRASVSIDILTKTYKLASTDVKVPIDFSISLPISFKSDAFVLS